LSVFTWAAPILLGLASFLRMSRFRLDFLMPAELFPIYLAGAVLLIIACLLAKTLRAWIISASAAAVGLFFGMQALAVLTGLASGRTMEGGIEHRLVIIALAAYVLAVVVTSVGGLVLNLRVAKAGEPAG